MHVNCMPARNPFLEFVQEHLSPLGEITSRPMFGGYCLYCDAGVFGRVANNQVFLKADDINSREFQGRNLPAFRPFDDQESLCAPAR